MSTGSRNFERTRESNPRPSPRPGVDTRRWRVILVPCRQRRSPRGRGVDVGGSAHSLCPRQPCWSSARPERALTRQAQDTHSTRVDMSSKHHKRHTDHKPQNGKAQQSSSSPCLEGDWDVTSITWSTTGLSFTGGAGTTVDIMSNGNVLETSRRVHRSWAARLGQVQRHRDGPLRLLTKDHVAFGYLPGLDRLRRCHHHSGRCDQARHVLTGAGLVQLRRKDLSLTFTSGGNTLTYRLSRWLTPTRWCLLRARGRRVRGSGGDGVGPEPTRS